MSADPRDTVRSDADERVTHATPVPTLSPLARAALANGLDFDDVYEYELATQRASGKPLDMPEALAELGGVL